MQNHTKTLNKFKKGAASFYIVAFSTLILVIVAVSFATVIISELARSSNDDLSQSAYDSALAGIEDAKVAYSNYRRCLATGATAGLSAGNSITCGDIIYWMENPDCYMVGHILGKINKSENTEVAIGGTVVTSGSTQTTTNQAYTCTEITTEVSDYRATLTSDNRRQTMRGQVGDGATNDVSKIRISWFATRSDITLKYTNFASSGSRVIFPALKASTIAAPPTIEVQIVQTAPSFTMSQFDETVISGANSQTDRATVYLVPTESQLSNENDYRIGAYNSGLGTNVVTAEQVAKTNSRTVSNKPFAVYCSPNSTSDFYCSADIELPSPIGSSDRTRNNDTFIVGVSLPYQQPDTDFSIEFICDSGTACATAAGASSGSSIASMIKNSQISIDSTGRANDLYRRVETRLETADTSFTANYPFYALQILNAGNANDTTTKKLIVTSEQDFYF